ncbi:hypothetical protein HDU87_002721 [Geranomyces variabilis]|uniref:WIBG Mago-binding domain-containing protein n=1 Tax=Geranomyces variabilis TaxID=109894 RepID=A0AAD5TRP0_9FUNG|nr:hypothetical protein HDU87_002721 [Geranomyces variabilis]
MSSVPQQSPGVSGIVEYKPGDRVIPASRRPDGTVRKERKVRPGFVPQEDAARYSNAKIDATKVPAGYVPGLQQGSTSQPVIDSAATKAAKKNAKRKAKKVEESLGLGGREAAADSGSSKPAAPLSDGGLPSTAVPAAAAAADPEKKLKALRKKLRQITEIEAKQSASTPLNDDQRQKVASKPELEAEVAELEKALSALAVQ